jgi:hypothetical protein
MTFASLTGRRTLAAAGIALGLASAAAVRIAVGSDHQDTPLVELNPEQDMTDVYAFPGSAPGRIALVLNSRAFLTPAQTPGASFDPNLLYQVKVDTDGDAIEDKVIQVTFTGTGASQQLQVRGPLDPPVTGAMQNEVADLAPTLSGPLNSVLGTSSGMQAFAGPRDDPFFIDLEAAFCILPDRKPSTGALSQPCALTAHPAAPFFFRTPGINYVAGFNVLSIVLELPSAQLEHGAPGRLGIWGTISR